MSLISDSCSTKSKSVVEQVSLDLRQEFPNVDGFSASNLWRMKQWFLFYTSEPEKLAQGVRELQSKENQEDTILYQSGREIVKRLKERMELLRKEMQATRRLMKKCE